MQPVNEQMRPLLVITTQEYILKKTPSITFEIVKRVRGDSDLHLHIEEALAIKKLGPQLNRREEGIGNGFLI